MSKSSNSKVSRRIKGEGTIRKRGNSYEGSGTVNVNGKSKQISVYGKTQRIVIEKMQELRKQKDDNYFIDNNNITLEKWIKEWMKFYKKIVCFSKDFSRICWKIKNNNRVFR